MWLSRVPTGLLQVGTGPGPGTGPGTGIRRQFVNKIKSLHFVEHRKSMTDNITILFFILNTSQINHFQTECLVRDTTGVEFGNSIGDNWYKFYQQCLNVFLCLFWNSKNRVYSCSSCYVIVTIDSAIGLLLLLMVLFLLLQLVNFSFLFLVLPILESPEIS